jgi:hypothetical protein
MTGSLHSTREVILRTQKWSEAISFYQTVL